MLMELRDGDFHETDSPESGPRRLFFKELRRKSMEGYLIMKTGQRIVVAAFGGALCLATSTGLSTAEFLVARDNDAADGGEF